MADNVAITAGSGTTVAADDVGSGVMHQRVKATWGPDGTGNDTDVASGKPFPIQLRTSLGVEAVSFNVTTKTSVTKSTDANAYTAGDVMSDSLSAPTAGGFTVTSAARISGGSGIITDAVITTSADVATLLQGEIWLFDTSVTAVNDNAAFVVSDTEILTYIGKIPFTMEDAGNNGSCHVTGLNIGFTCSGSANLRFLIKVKNAYTGVASEVIGVMLKIIQTN